MTNKQAARVVVSKDGPYLISGNLPLSHETIETDPAGGSESWARGKTFPKQERYALCRCGHSKAKPFCDGTHNKVGFDGTETADRRSYREQANIFDGPTMQLRDAEPLCGFARFCDPHGQVWSQVTRTDDAAVRATFLRQVGNCPSGRLVAWDKASGEAIEPKLPATIGLIEDPAQQCSGPIWLRGGIPVVAADGFEYEVRNRVTLCRCGQSKHKPFCDGAHAAVKFQDTT